MMPDRVTETLLEVERLHPAIDRIEARLKSLGESSASPQEKTTASPQQIYSGYTNGDLSVFEPYAQIAPVSNPGFITDFLGVRTRSGFVRGAEGLDGGVTGIPVPDDGWHAEAIEWIGLLKSVRGAAGSYSAMELGAGWGPWVVAGAVAARHRGMRDINLCAVEADPGHFRFMLEHFRDNGLDPSAHDLIQAAVGAEAGLARWPAVEDPAADWGSRPVIDLAAASDHLGRRFEKWMEVKIVAFGDLLRRRAVWDLVHIDIQGGEVDICRAVGAALDERVRWLVIGTHDARLHGELMELLFQRGWTLENEKPPRFTWRDGAPSLISMGTADGAQVWRNPRLAANPS